MLTKEGTLVGVWSGAGHHITTRHNAYVYLNYETTTWLTVVQDAILVHVWWRHSPFHLINFPYTLLPITQPWSGTGQAAPRSSFHLLNGKIAFACRTGRNSVLSSIHPMSPNFI